MFAISRIVDAALVGLEREARRCDEEQAVYGLDALDELRLHPLLAGAFEEAGFGVHREQRYPSDRRRRRRQEGDRCDFVLTPDARELAAPDAEPTLFDPPDAVPLSEAFWLEAKLAAQFTTAGPNPRYTAQLLSTPRQDVSKLKKDPAIHHAGLLIVLFAEDQHVADHDLEIWNRRALEHGLPIGAAAVRLLVFCDRSKPRTKNQ
ncbi:MAG: hypothetical protein ACYSTY_14310 [Planctomycetota bacterium]|jgi:hypothetical protein